MPGDADRPAGRAIALALALPLAAAPLLRDLMHPFQSVAGFRALVCLLELGLVLAWLVRGPRPALPKLSPPVAILLTAWIVLASVATLAASYPVPALVRHAEWVCHGLFGLALWHLRIDRPALAGTVFAAIVIGFLLVTAALVAHWVAFPNPAAYDWSLELPFFDHVRHYGYLAMAALCGCTYWLAVGNSTIGRRIGAGLAFTIALAALLWTGGRGAALGAAVGLAVAVLLGAPRARRWIAGVLLLALAPAVLVAGLLRVDIPIMGIDRLLGRTAAYSGVNEFSTGRADIWRYTADAIREHPLLGLGPDGFAYLSPPVMKLPVQPHSMPLQIVSDWGAPAALAFLGLLAVAAYRWWRAARAASPASPERAVRATAGAVIAAMAAHGLVDGTFYHALPLAILAACTALALGRASSAPTATGNRYATGIAALVTAAATLVILAHTAVVLTVTSATVPAPGSWRVQLVQAFPSRINQRTLRPWLTRWEASHPDEALQLARWAQRRARHPWWYHYYEADRLAGSDRDAAARAFAAAIHHAPPAEVARLRGEYRRRFGAPAD